MSRQTHDELIHLPLNKGMDQSVSPFIAPPGTLYTVQNCRKRGQGVLESRPGLKQLPSTCVGQSTHYIAGDGTTGYVYRPCFLTRLEDTPMLGTTAGEVFAYAGGVWNFCGRFSTCLPIKKHTGIAPNTLFPDAISSNPPFPPQVAVNSSGFVMCVAQDTAGGISAYIDSPDGVRQVVTWSTSSTVLRARVVSVGASFFLFWQAGTSVSVNTYTPTAGTGFIGYSESAGYAPMAAAGGYWDVTANSTHMFFAWKPTDSVIQVSKLNTSIVDVATAQKTVGSGNIPVSLYVNSVTGNVWLGFNNPSFGVTGTNTSANVDTTTNKTLRIRLDKALSYTSITVTSGAATPKTTIVTDLNAVFVANSMHLSASITGTNQLLIVNTSTVPGVPGNLVDIDIVGNGSNLNIAVGFPAGGAIAHGGATCSIYSSTLAVVLDYATLYYATNSANYGAPTFGLSRGTGVNTSGLCNFFIGFFQIVAPSIAGMYVGTAGETGSVSSVAFQQLAWPVSKPDNYGRIWVLIHTGVNKLLVSRYALLRYFDMRIDISDPTNVRLLSPATVELVSESFVAFDNELVNSNASTQRTADYFTPIASGATANFFPMWAPLQFIDGDSIPASATMQTLGVLAQAQVLEYTSVELDRPIDTHRDADPVQQSLLVSGQPVELFGQSTAEVINGIASGTQNAAYSAGAAEIGFLHPPVIADPVNAGASATPAAGSYQYKAVYQWVDTYGRRHISAPSLPVTFAADGAHAVRIDVFMTRLTQRQSRNSMQAVEVVLYRTVASGTEFHETTMRATFNATANTFLTFTDDTPDASISDNGFLYTEGGVLPNDIAPSCRFATRSDDRVWFGGLWDPTLIQCSKIIVPQEPIQTPDSPAFQVQLPKSCTGISYMDGQVIAFAKDAIFLIAGDGPNDQGNGSFSVRTLTKTIGCLDYRSILETEAGTLFQSTHGIYMIPRGFGPPVYAGAAVQDLMLPSASDAPPEILSAVYSQNQQGSLARFLLRDSSGAAGGSTVLLMDTSGGEWFSDLLGHAAREAGYLSYSSALILGPGAAYASPDFSNASATLSPVLYETVTNRYDQAFLGSTLSCATMMIQSAWLTPFGLGGGGRFTKALGAFRSDTSGITFTETLQVDDKPPQSNLWTLGATLLNTTQYRGVDIAQQAGTAAQLTLSLSPTSFNTTAGYTAKFIAATVELHSDRGIRLLSAEEKK